MVPVMKRNEFEAEHSIKKRLCVEILLIVWRMTYAFVGTKGIKTATQVIGSAELISAAAGVARLLLDLVGFVT